MRSIEASQFHDQLLAMKQSVETSKSFDEALDFLMDIVSEFGFTQVLYAYQPASPRLPNGDWLPLKLNVRNFPDGWEEGWTRFSKMDPYYHACFEGTLPINWAQVQAREDLKSIQREACKYLCDYGLSNGISVPAHLPFGRFAVMSVIVDHKNIKWQRMYDSTWECMFSLMHLFTKLIFELSLDSKIEVFNQHRLTPREVECMRWAAAGKTTEEIAIILNRSVETIRLHVKNAISKLKSTNKAQAVGTAIQLGLI